MSVEAAGIVPAARGLFVYGRRAYTRADGVQSSPTIEVVTIETSSDFPPATACRFFLLSALVVALTIAATGCDRTSDSSSGGAESSTASERKGPDDDQRRSGPTENDTYFVEVVPEPNPIPFQQLFEFRVRVFEDQVGNSPAKDVDLDQVRARMPAHDHGMKTSPSISEHGPGEFLAEGMRFHMRGEGEDGRWVLQLVFNGPDGIDRANFEYQCCVQQ